MTDHGESSSRDPRSSVDPGVAALWASAFVILAMIIVQAGRLGAGNAAFAGNASEVANLRVLTSQANVDQDVLTILNQTDETIVAYGVVNQRSVELYDASSLRVLFSQGAASARGGR